jgi:hypothetical protein
VGERAKGELPMLQLKNRPVVVLAIFAIWGCLMGCHDSSPDAPEIWKGTISTGKESRRIQFDLTEHDGNVSGLLFVDDPDTHEMVPAGALKGKRSAQGADWQIATGTVSVSYVDDKTLAGVVNFNDQGRGTLTARLQLSREE